jgi:hypothetical protein
MADDELTPSGLHSRGGRPHTHGVKREDAHGSTLANISQTKQDERSAQPGQRQEMKVLCRIAWTDRLSRAT